MNAFVRFCTLLCTLLYAFVYAFKAYKAQSVGSFSPYHPKKALFLYGKQRFFTFGVVFYSLSVYDHGGGYFIYSLHKTIGGIIYESANKRRCYDLWKDGG